MTRSEMLNGLEEAKEWDIIVIGGGATGLGIALDAASRGYTTILFEKYDFAKGTSSRATKLVHGGVRYLAQGNIKLVREALHERGLLLQNAPHVTRKQSFIIPSYKWWSKWYYGIGLSVYDAMAGKLGLGKTKILSRQKVLEEIPFAETEHLNGGVCYFDGQFDDARLAINLAQTAAEHGAIVLNYFPVTGLTIDKKKIKGVLVKDDVTGRQYEVRGKSVVNATGVFADDVLRMEDATTPGMVTPSQGVHLVVDKKFFPGNSALMIPKTDDGRVLFAVPWHDKVVVGTTDTPVESTSPEPRALEEEIEFILHHFNRYITADITRKDVLSAFTGLRPLVKTSNTRQTALISRDHTIVVSTSGLITITGGKWTTYRKMAKDAVQNAGFVAKLEKKNCVTEHLRIHGWMETIDESDPLHYYGADAAAIRKIAEEKPELARPIHPAHPYLRAEIVWAVREEMAMTIEDVLARRIRLLFLDARAAIESAPVVAACMANELKKDQGWIEKQVGDFTKLASGYIL